MKNPSTDEDYRSIPINVKNILSSLQFRNYKAWVGREIVRGLLSMQGMESGLDVEKTGE